MLLFSLNCRVQIGIRLVFPLVATLLVALAAGLSRALSDWPDRHRAIALGVLTVAVAYPAVRTWPDGIRYANELWGGPEAAAPLLADANYDWGQGLMDLDRWTAEHGLPTAKVWYYGMDPVIGKDPVRLLRLHDPIEYPVPSRPTCGNTSAARWSPSARRCGTGIRG